MADTSEDLLADRRFGWAIALVADGDHLGAADLLEQVIERAPLWAPAWAALAQAREHLGNKGAALAAWRRAAALDPDDRLGASLAAGRLSGQDLQALPAAYLRALFDDYAPRFERHLVEDLGYRGPQLVADALADLATDRRFSRAVDLGCGTGLMARAIAGRAETIDGVDIAPNMVEAARRTGLYANLTVGALEPFLAGAPPRHYDLVTAADVLVYVGDLAPVMGGVGRVLVPGGLFAFTVQQGEGHAFRLGRDLRFAHSRIHVESSAEAAGLELLRIDLAWARTENGSAVPGLLVVAARRH